MAAPPGRHGQFRDWNHGLVPKLWGLGHVLAPKPPWPGYGPALATLLEGGAVPPAKASARVYCDAVLAYKARQGSRIAVLGSGTGRRLYASLKVEGSSNGCEGTVPKDKGSITSKPIRIMRVFEFAR